jgi:hypothetical protein
MSARAGWHHGGQHGTTAKADQAALYGGPKSRMYPECCVFPVIVLSIQDDEKDVDETRSASALFKIGQSRD